MDSVRQLFLGRVSEMGDNEDRVYRSFSDLSLFIKSLRAKGLASGEVSDLLLAGAAAVGRPPGRRIDRPLLGQRRPAQHQ